jgi:flagellar FliJ protein
VIEQQETLHMQKPHALTLLQELCQRRADLSARELGLLLEQCGEAEQKLHQLVAWRSDYQNRLGHSVHGGIGGSALLNFHAFLHNLDRTIEQQSAMIAGIRQRIDNVREQWQAQRRKKGSYEVIDRRHECEAQRTEERRQQRLQDEFAARSAARTVGEAD